MLQDIIEEYKKCTACGYEYQWDTINKERIFIKGDEDFIKIIGKFAFETVRRVREIDLYMCPKCYTVKGDLDFKYNMKERAFYQQLTKDLNKGTNNIFDKE